MAFRMSLIIGDLVTSSEFSGIGKLASVDEIQNRSTVCFFESPEEPNSRPISIESRLLNKTELRDEAIIYCIHPVHGKWQRGRYGGPRPNGKCLVIFRSDDHKVFSISDIFVINIGAKNFLDPRAFLSQRCSDTPLFYDLRSDFINSYVQQRNSCRSISSVLSSGVELEAYQLAVVRRVLKDEVKKYLLADEVGLGKTIEAGMIIRELLVENYSRKAIIVVPESLVQQWTDELTQRFFLEALIDENLIICSHENLEDALSELASPPDIVVVDEAHQIASWAWSDDPSVKERYDLLAATCDLSEVCLLLSGTPLSGNETNFLSMLHLLNSESYSLTTEGIDDFRKKIAERESIGGIYQALTPSNDNASLSDLLKQILSIIPTDKLLYELVSLAFPLVDWMDGVEDGDERAEAILSIRIYLGENYRLHQRMLRNRREDPYIASLFPGLIGVDILPWSIDEACLSVEQSLDAFRDEYLAKNTKTVAITLENFRDWISAALINPNLIAEKACELLSEDKNGLEPFERETLEELIENSKQEQEEKDFLLEVAINDWLRSNCDGKIVVFAGDIDSADYVFLFLSGKLGPVVERHNVDRRAVFLDSDDVRILVCDEQGEDGLNLHGGEKLVIHYGLPLSISRIEQRLGRVNRYSADIKASPIKSLVFVPQGMSFSHYWVKLLSEDIKIFSESVASLQYVLDPLIEDVWKDASQKGFEGLVALGNELRGGEGFIHRERLKIRAQEQLNNLESEIEEAKNYSLRITAADEEAEAQAQSMQGWLTKGLLFKKSGIIADRETETQAQSTQGWLAEELSLKRSRGPAKSAFRYKYQPSTLMDCNTFISKCLLGIDFKESTRTAPVTHLMSFDRALCSHGNNIHPFRYGQPFLDTIYNALNTDSRGISAAHIRFLQTDKLKEPIAYFHIEWLISHKCINRIIGDETYPPHVLRQWLDASGRLIESQPLIRMLEKPYSKAKAGTVYKDVNLRTERWGSVEEYFPESDWAELVNNAHREGLSIVRDSLERETRDELSVDCLTMGVVILAPEA